MLTALSVFRMKRELNSSDDAVHFTAWDYLLSPLVSVISFFMYLCVSECVREREGREKDRERGERVIPVAAFKFSISIDDHFINSSLIIDSDSIIIKSYKV